MFVCRYSFALLCGFLLASYKPICFVLFFFFLVLYYCLYDIVCVDILDFDLRSYATMSHSFKKGLTLFVHVNCKLGCWILYKLIFCALLMNLGLF